MKFYPSIFPHPSKVVEHMFATNGNGINLNNKGYLSANYGGDEIYDFPEPVPYSFIYPWSTHEEFQPFRDLAGCRDKGFKECVQYFIDCIMVTPDDVEYIKPWKDNIETVKDVLLNTPPIEDPYSINDMEKFLNDIKDSMPTSSAPVDGTDVGDYNSVYKVWYFDVQWSDCPTLVENEVISAWQEQELGNDRYMWKTELNKDLFDNYPRVYFWLKHKGVTDGEKVVIHWWW